MITLPFWNLTVLQSMTDRYKLVFTDFSSVTVDHEVRCIKLSCGVTFTALPDYDKIPVFFRDKKTDNYIFNDYSKAVIFFKEKLTEYKTIWKKEFDKEVTKHSFPELKQDINIS